MRDMFIQPGEREMFIQPGEREMFIQPGEREMDRVIDDDDVARVELGVALSGLGLADVAFAVEGSI